MYNYIIISHCLFGSVYLFSKSLELINNLLLENKNCQHKLIIINGLTFVLSSGISLYSFSYLLSNFRAVRILNAGF
jgi:hypothetical protein